MDGFATRAIHVGSESDPTTGAVIQPITLSTTFRQVSPANPVGEYEYTRSANPNRASFEKAIASLESGKHGLAFSSGSTSTAVILQSLAAGKHVVSVSDVYGGTHRYFTQVSQAHGINVSFADLTDASSLIGHLTEETKIVWIESPSNPTLQLVDIAEIAKITKTRGIILVVDNTFLSPYICNPLTIGADIVTHSVTKYINGYSDVLMGVLACNDDKLYERLKFMQNAIGCVPSPFDCYLAHRGVRTLHLRMRAISQNALAIAQALEKSEHVLSVSHPSLPSHPQHKLAQRQHRDGLSGGMVSFRIASGQRGAHLFVSHTRLFTLAESLGGVESLCEIPAAMTHAGIPKDVREKVGVYDDLVRLSVGIEDAEDLVADVKQALEYAAKETSKA